MQELREERVEECERKYVGGGTRAGKFMRILEGEVRYKTFGKYEEVKEVQKKEKVRECKAASEN